MNTEPVKLNQKDKAKLRRIRRMIEKTHWTQGEYHTDQEFDADSGVYVDSKDRYCLVGFVNHISGFSDPRMESSMELEDVEWEADQSGGDVKLRGKLLNALEAAISQYVKRRKRYSAIGGKSELIESFNDSPRTERKDILAVLDSLL